MIISGIPGIGSGGNSQKPDNPDKVDDKASQNTEATQTGQSSQADGTEGASSGPAAGTAAANETQPVAPSASVVVAQPARAEAQSVVIAQTDAPEPNVLEFDLETARAAAEAYRETAQIEGQLARLSQPVEAPDLLVTGVDGTVLDPEAADPFSAASDADAAASEAA